MSSATFTSIGEAHNMVLTQSKIHLYGPSPKKRCVTSRFASEALHSDTMRLHIVGDLEVLLMPPSAMEKHLESTSFLKHTLAWFDLIMLNLCGLFTETGRPHP